MTTSNPRPRPALSKAPSDGHPAAISEPTPEQPTPQSAKSETKLTGKSTQKSKKRATSALGAGSTSDTLRGKGKKKQQRSTLRDNEKVDLTVELPRSLRRRIRAAAKAADLSVDAYLQTVLDSTLP